MKIAVYAISKNEGKFVKRFCDSAKDADIILIADTGSTDKTIDIAKECGAVVHMIHIAPWRFDLAREVSLALIPANIDVCICLDLDEVLEPGWREEIERVWQPATTRMRYKFDWSNGVVFHSDKIHSRKGYRWKHPCHEILVPVTEMEENLAWTDKLLVSHYPDDTKSRGHYMELLEMSIKEDPDCPRNALYYARELWFCRRYDEAIVGLKRYLALPRADWANERSYAMKIISKCYAALKNESETIKWARLSAAEDPSVRDGWMELADAAYRSNMWAECYSAALSALTLKHRVNVYTEDPVNWTEKPHDLASISAWHLGLKEQAIEYCKRAIDINPEDSRLIKNLEFMVMDTPE